MNFQHAVAFIRRIHCCNELTLDKITLAICVLLSPTLLAQVSPLAAEFASVPASSVSDSADNPIPPAAESPQHAIVQPMAQQATVLGNRANFKQTPPDRTVAMLTPKAIDLQFDLLNDPRRDQQWSFFQSSYYKGASALFAARAHNSGNYPVVVAVVDSGVMLSHEDLEMLQGYDFISDSRVANDGDGRDSDPSDPGDWVTALESTTTPVSNCPASNSKWHGTAVSGIIGAISGNQRGIAGGAPSVLLLPVRVTGKCGGYIKDLVDGVRWAAGLAVDGAPANEHPARIINLSVGFSGSCPVSLQNAIDAAVDTGAAVIVAATNSAVVLDTYPHSPASCANVTTVGALLRDGSLAPYSAVGNKVALLAPGGSANDGIITTQNDSQSSPTKHSSYGFHFGTSMAAAHVSATFATLLSIDPSLTNGQLGQLVRQSATSAKQISGCKRQRCGAGRLNAQKAADLLISKSANQLLNEPSSDANLAVLTETLVTQPPSAAANSTTDDSTTDDTADGIPASLPTKIGTGQSDLESIAPLLAIAYFSRWRRRIQQPSAFDALRRQAASWH